MENVGKRLHRFMGFIIYGHKNSSQTYLILDFDSFSAMAKWLTRSKCP